MRNGWPSRNAVHGTAAVRPERDGDQEARPRGGRTGRARRATPRPRRPAPTSVPSAQLGRAPDDFAAAANGSPWRLVLGHEKVARHEPLADDDAAEDGEGDERERGVDGDRADAPARACATARRCASASTRPRPAPRRSPATLRSESGRRARARCPAWTPRSSRSESASRSTHAISNATPSTVSASSSGSVIGVACR